MLEINTSNTSGSNAFQTICKRQFNSLQTVSGPPRMQYVSGNMEWMELCFERTPDVFNGVHIWGTGQPIHDWNRSIFKPFLRNFRRVDCCIILLVDYIVFDVVSQGFNEWEEVIA